jgi:hypothetical protein
VAVVAGAERHADRSKAHQHHRPGRRFRNRWGVILTDQSFNPSSLSSRLGFEAPISQTLPKGPVELSFTLFGELVLPATL